jgi:hypothetical protein
MKNAIIMAGGKGTRMSNHRLSIDKKQGLFAKKRKNIPNSF